MRDTRAFSVWRRARSGGWEQIANGVSQAAARRILDKRLPAARDDAEMMMTRAGVHPDSVTPKRTKTQTAR